jgi:hypothetical protein
MLLAHRPLLSLYHNNKPVQSERFTIGYNAGIARAVGNSSNESFEVVMSATKESPLFLNKVSRIKLYRYPDSDRCGLYFASSRDGVFLWAEWTAQDGLWNHLVNNYVSISG